MADPQKNRKGAELAERVTQLQRLNDEIRDSRRAALNVMEDAVLSREALRINEQRMRGQKEAFQAVVDGASLVESLARLSQMAETETGGEARTAFFIANAEGTGLFMVRGAGSMPDAYADAVDGFLIGNDSLARGLAVPTGEPVVTSDVHNDPLWASWTHMADEHDYRGCWAFPIKTGDNKPVGTFAMYFRAPREATPSDYALADIITQSAALIINSDTEARERARTEAELRESEARIRTLSDAVPQIIWTNTADGTANYFNQRWYEYTGLDYEQSAGPGWQAIVHPGDAPASVERWERALASGQVFDTEYRLRGANGTYRWFLGRNVPLKDAAGVVTGWFGSATDIEDWKQAQTARDESEERFRLLVEGARDYAMFLLDADGRITFWSTGAERVFGWGQRRLSVSLPRLFSRRKIERITNRRMRLKPPVPGDAHRITAGICEKTATASGRTGF